RRKVPESLVEPRDHEFVHSERFEDLDALGFRRQVAGDLIRRHELGGMPVESEHGGPPAMTACVFDGLPNQLLVADVDSVEHPNGQRAGVEGFGDTLKPAPDTHTTSIAALADHDSPENTFTG